MLLAMEDDAGAGRSPLACATSGMACPAEWGWGRRGTTPVSPLPSGTMRSGAWEDMAALMSAACMTSSAAVLLSAEGGEVVTSP